MAQESLHRLSTSDLAIGRPLRGDICDQTGRVLMNAGEMLTRQHLDALAKSGVREYYGGTEWEPPQEREPTPEELLAALQQRQSATGKLKVRRHERFDCEAHVRLIVEETARGGGRCREIDVVTCDVSASGFSFVFAQFLHAGTILRAHFDVLPGKPNLTAIVRYCRHEGQRNHRIGAEFISNYKRE